MKTIATIRWYSDRFGNNCSVRFDGYDNIFYYDKWNKIDVEPWANYKKKIKPLENHREFHRAELAELDIKIKRAGKWYVPWRTKEEKRLLQDRSEILEKIWELNKQIEKYKDEYESENNAYRIHSKAVEFLLENGFTMLSNTVDGRSFCTETWTK